eukprot:20642-Pleurochrysis_carterae.AAC.3
MLQSCLPFTCAMYGVLQGARKLMSERQRPHDAPPIRQQALQKPQPTADRYDVIVRPSTTNSEERSTSSGVEQVNIEFDPEDPYPGFNFEPIFSPTSESGYFGVRQKVRKRSKKWRAFVSKKSLGLFSTVEKAVYAVHLAVSEQYAHLRPGERAAAMRNFRAKAMRVKLGGGSHEQRA